MSGKGSIEAVYSGMFGGKTTYLEKIYQKRKGEGVLAVKASIDNRYSSGEVLVTHDGKTIPATLIDVNRPESILTRVNGKYEMLLLDEAMFMAPGIIAVLQELRDRGLRVVAAGLDKTAELAPFGPMPDIIAIADKRTQLFARCDFDDKNNATLSYTKRPKDTDVEVGGAELYGAVCEVHHHLLHHGKIFGQ